MPTLRCDENCQCALRAAALEKAARKVEEALDIHGSLIRMPTHVALALVNLQRVAESKEPGPPPCPACGGTTAHFLVSCRNLHRVVEAKSLELPPCPTCGGAMRLLARDGRTREYHRGVPVSVPDDFKLPTCTECGEELAIPEIDKQLEKLLESRFADALARECDRLQKTLNETWKVIGGPPEHPGEDPEVAELPNAVRVCINYEADKASQLRDLLRESQADLEQVKRERNFVAADDDAFWIWSDTDPNGLSSLVDGALVKMTAGQLRKILSEKSGEVV